MRRMYSTHWFGSPLSVSCRCASAPSFVVKLSQFQFFFELNLLKNQTFNEGCKNMSHCCMRFCSLQFHCRRGSRGYRRVAKPSCWSSRFIHFLGINMFTKFGGSLMIVWVIQSQLDSNLMVIQDPGTCWYFQSANHPLQGIQISDSKRDWPWAGMDSPDFDPPPAVLVPLAERDPRCHGKKRWKFLQIHPDSIGTGTSKGVSSVTLIQNLRLRVSQSQGWGCWWRRLGQEHH